jgi:hypothetical protein
LGDGTFGRALKCTQVAGEFTKTPEGESQSEYAIKVVRAVQRYTESAKFEASILMDLHR